MKLGENEGLRDLMARLLELLKLEAEEEGAMFGLPEGGDGTASIVGSGVGGAAPPDLPSEWIGLIGHALSRLVPGGQLSVLLSRREANESPSLIIAELEEEWERGFLLPEGKTGGALSRSGSIEVDSVAGLGTTFTLYMPKDQIAQE